LVYHKHYLVPIVERVPFLDPRWFRLKWFGGFGKGRGLPLYPTAMGRFGVLICYESVFEDRARAYRRQGADFLVNVTNDAWYGRTAGPYQHAAHLVLRAVETRMGIARAANSGISGTVDPLGRYHDTTGLEVETAIAATLRTSDVTTLYVRLGDWVGTMCVLATLGFGGTLQVRKVTTTPDDPAVGMFRAVDLLGTGETAIDVLVHGTTIATNALLERRGARVALVTTLGFEDLLWLRRQERASLYDLARDHPPPLVAREHVVGVAERMGPPGVLEPLADREVERVVAAVRTLAPEAVAVAFLFAFRHPEHERRVATALRGALAGIPVTASHEVLPAFR